jgi:23S rRNA-/tRNA-specific pseudouridylate synthase
MLNFSKLYFTCFRHETPVLATDIEIIHLDEDLVVLDKPCSIPVDYFSLV